jgi:hypothetical protein
MKSLQKMYVPGVMLTAAMLVYLGGYAQTADGNAGINEANTLVTAGKVHNLRKKRMKESSCTDLIFVLFCLPNQYPHENPYPIINGVLYFIGCRDYTSAVGLGQNHSERLIVRG